MRYDESMGAVVASASELAAAVATSGFSFGALAPVWLTEAASQPDASGVPLPQEGADALDAAVRALADPARIAVAHTMVADALIRRMTLAWDRERGVVAMAGFGPDGVAVTVMPPEQLYAFLAGSVALAAHMTASLYRPSMTGSALLALLGCADAFRAASMRATLGHVSPSGSISAEEVAQALADSATRDVRWLAPFVEEVLPFRISEALQTAEVEEALASLAEVDAVTLLEAEEGFPTIVEPTDGSADFFDGLLHESARLAVTLSEMDGDGVRWETMVLVRSADGLWLADLTPGGGAIAGLSRREADLLLRSIAGLAEEEADADPETAVVPEPSAPAASPEPEAPAAPQAPPPSGPSCHACGPVGVPGDQFCRKCGAPLG